MEAIETFRDIAGYSLQELVQKEPSCLNGMVRIEKYKITVEKIHEPKEVYVKRLQKLWDECDNRYNRQPLQIEAKKLDIELKGDVGNKRKKI